MSENDVWILWCLIDGEDRPFYIKANRTWVIAELADCIYERRKDLRANHDINDIFLWKVTKPTSVDPEEGFRDRFPCPISDFLDQSIVTRLNERTRSASDLFPALARDQLQIVVQVKSPGKRRAEAEPDTDQQQNNNATSKRSKIDHGVRDNRLPIEDVLKMYHEGLQHVESDPLWYSNPRNYSPIPFPFSYPNIPERFSLQNGSFQYMGRAVFQEVYDNVRLLKLGSEYTKLYIHGTMGYGKSYILAALACLLYREGKRVVFIPDCRALLGQAIPYMKSALLCAFADPSLEKQRERIRACTSEDEINAFCHSLDDTLYFIVDQINAFDLSPPNTDVILDDEKKTCSSFITRLGLGNLTITSASANYETVLHMDQKQTGELKTTMMGGMRDEEMKQWWNHHEGQLPMLDHLGMVEIEDLTGCIPLLLRPLLRFTQQNFRAVENNFWTSPEIVAVGTNIMKFAKDRNNEGVEAYNDYLETLFNCMTWGSTFENQRKSFDYRYFYANSYKGECACGIARQAAAQLVAQRKIGKFYGSEWINTLHIYKNNPSALGFQVELICLSIIADYGIDYGLMKTKSMIPTWFPGNLDDLLDKIPVALEPGFSQLFFPLDSQFKDIDAAYVTYNAKSNTLTVVPIQITINERHKDSETLFYQKWSKWEERFSDYKLTTTFLWIIRDDFSWRTVMKEIKKTRNNLYKMPEHGQARITIERLYKPLYKELQRIRAMQ